MKNMISKSGKTMNGSSHTYRELVMDYAPRPIRSEDDYWAARQRMDALLDKHELTRDEQDYLDIIGVVIEAYEQDTEDESDYELRGVALIRALLAEQGLRQKDLVDVFKTESIASAVLNGHRSLTVEHIARLAQRFDLPHVLFFTENDVAV